jgi:hypothetical protein
MSFNKSTPENPEIYEICQQLISKVEEENSRNTLLEEHISSLNKVIKTLQYQVITANRAAAYAMNNMNNMNNMTNITNKTSQPSNITTIVE